MFWTNVNMVTRKSLLILRQKEHLNVQMKLKSDEADNSIPKLARCCYYGRFKGQFGIQNSK